MSQKMGGDFSGFYFFKCEEELPFPLKPHIGYSIPMHLFVTKRGTWALRLFFNPSLVYFFGDTGGSTLTKAKLFSFWDEGKFSAV